MFAAVSSQNKAFSVHSKGQADYRDVNSCQKLYSDGVPDPKAAIPLFGMKYPKILSK